MRKHYRWLESALVLLAYGLLGIEASSATGSPGYLPAVGVVPVRLQAPPTVVPIVLWPPLLQPEKLPIHSEVQMTNAPTVETPGMESSHTNPLPTAAASSVDSPPPQPSMVTPFPLLEQVQSGPAEEKVLDPQALLNYLLSVSTNESGAKVIMPIFVPPAPPLPQPASHATYESR
jgi:hypothetical protein